MATLSIGAVCVFPMRQRGFCAGRRAVGGATVHEQLCLLHALPQSNHVTSASMPQSKHATSASTAPKQARRVSQHCSKASTLRQPSLLQSKHVASASTAPKQARCVSQHCSKASTLRQLALPQSKHIASASTAPKQAHRVSQHAARGRDGTKGQVRSGTGAAMWVGPPT